MSSVLENVNGMKEKCQ